MEQLPQELQSYIYEYLPLSSLGSMKRVSSSYRNDTEIQRAYNYRVNYKLDDYRNKCGNNTQCLAENIYEDKEFFRYILKYPETIEIYELIDIANYNEIKESEALIIYRYIINWINEASDKQEYEDRYDQAYEILYLPKISINSLSALSSQDLLWAEMLLGNYLEEADILDAGVSPISSYRKALQDERKKQHALKLLEIFESYITKFTQ